MTTRKNKKKEYLITSALSCALYEIQVIIRKKKIHIEKREAKKYLIDCFWKQKNRNNDSRRRKYMEFTSVYHRPTGRKNPAGQRREEHRRCYGGVSRFRYTQPIIIYFYLSKETKRHKTENLI